MLLLHAGVDVPESQLRELCDTTWLGTDAVQVITAARQLGFKASRKHTLNLSELQNLVDKGAFPIILVSLLPINAHPDLHAVIVLAFEREQVRVHDPLIAERLLPLETFRTAWHAAHNVTLLIER
jgi:ABC-type bacteriocin/lantibiotic exporter with double-glycine peptidase domain